MINPEQHISLKEARATWHDPESMRHLADYYWRVIVLIALVIVVCVFAYGAFNLFRVLDEFTPVPPTSISKTNQAFDSAKLDATLSIFSARKAQFEALGATSTPISSQ